MVKEQRKIKRNSINPQNSWSNIKSSSQRRGIDLYFSRSTFFQWFNKQNKHCIYCKQAFKENENSFGDRISIDRIDNDQPYTLSNIQLVCYGCNRAKADYWTHKEMLIIGNTIKKLKKVKI